MSDTMRTQVLVDGERHDIAEHVLNETLALLQPGSAADNMARVDPNRWARLGISILDTRGVTSWSTDNVSVAVIRGNVIIGGAVRSVASFACPPIGNPVPAPRPSRSLVWSTETNGATVGVDDGHCIVVFRGDTQITVTNVEAFAQALDHARVSRDMLVEPVPKPPVSLTCDMTHACAEPVTHIDEKGWLYCTDHGGDRAAGGRQCRQLLAHELAELRAGRPIAWHTPVVPS